MTFIVHLNCKLELIQPSNDRYDLIVSLVILCVLCKQCELRGDEEEMRETPESVRCP
jgi:hypothetical protein